MKPGFFSMIALAALGALALPAAAQSVKIAKVQGDNQKLLVGPAFETLKIKVTDAEGKPVGGAEVVFSCRRSPSGPCITLPERNFTTFTTAGGEALFTRKDRRDATTWEPGVEHITARVKAGLYWPRDASATFTVEFVADAK